MALEGKVRELFEEIKYKRKFPPRERVGRIKSELAVRGLGRSGALVEQISAAYLEEVEAILEEFTEAVMARSVVLGVRSDETLRALIANAHQQMFNDGRGAALDEFKGTPDYGKMAIAIIDARRGPVWEHLERKMRLEKPVEAVSAPTKEREQKFGILLSPTQALRDFEGWTADAKKWGNPIAIVFVDLDHFRALNERLTHAKVDQTILPEAQRLLARLVQGRGEAYRYGGEEFILIVPNLDREEATAFAEKIRASFERHRFEADGGTQTVTVSVGVAIGPTDGTSYQDVLEAANRAEAEAKKTRNTVRVVTPKQ